MVETGRPYWTTGRTLAAITILLAIHWVLGVSSLLRENPTVDEVLHLPAGISYWQTGRFKLYHHNPPLVKLIAALPALAGGVETVPLYREKFWMDDPPNKTWFGHEFMRLNAKRYFEIFARSRLLMPAFSLVGGIIVFLWSRHLFGTVGGLVSLTLWCFSPNVLAHARLITTDVPAASLMIAATYLFWRMLKSPDLRLATAAGLTLGLAQLTKYSALVLLGIWPMLWVLERIRPTVTARPRRLLGDLGLGSWIVFLMILVINLGYGFEGTGMPLGHLPFVSRALARDRDPLPPGPKLPFDLYGELRTIRVNRFVGTPLEHTPIPLPREYLLGFDDQKFEAEGAPVRAFDRRADSGEVSGYPVYLNGVLRDRSWWYYYFLALTYKVPEGTWALAIAASAALAIWTRRVGNWRDILSVLAVPAVILLVMSVFTNINLGLRYVLPSFPFLFVLIGALADPRIRAGGSRSFLISAFLAISLGTVVVSTLAIHPHYLAYFNVLSGGPSRGSEHLIDSNLDWGQDLVGLKRWLDFNAPGEPVGIAYFGQISPQIFEARGETLDWYLPPALPGSWRKGPPPLRYRIGTGPEGPLPGLYAISGSLVRGLPWRVYDRPIPGQSPSMAWVPYEAGEWSYSYFQALEPIAKVGYSIFLYRITEEQSARLAKLWSSR